MTTIDCEICFSTIEIGEEINCYECNEKVQCVSCVISNNHKCCYCSVTINIYEFLLMNFNCNLFNKIHNNLFNKIHNYAMEHYARIFLLNSAFDDWIFSEKKIQSHDINTVYVNFMDFLSSTLKKDTLKQKNALRYLLSFHNKSQLPNIAIETRFNTKIQQEDVVLIKNQKTTIETSIENKLENKVEKSSGELKQYIKALYTEKSFKIYFIDELSNITKNINNSLDTEILKDTCEKLKYNRFCTQIIPVIINNIPVPRACDSVYLIRFFSLLSYYAGPLFSHLLKETVNCVCNNLSCKSCNNIYCEYCLFELQKCNCETYNSKEEVKDVKLCPSCKELVFKDSGCDDMWCVNCKAFFSWNRGIIRYDNPHNPDFLEYNMKEKFNNNNFSFIKNLILNEILRIENGIANEEHFITEYLSDINYYNVLNCHRDIKKHIISKLLRQSLVLNIIKVDSIEKRSFETINKIINLCEKYKKIIIELLGYKNYIESWDVVGYEHILVHTNQARVLYKLH